MKLSEINVTETTNHNTYTALRTVLLYRFTLGVYYVLSNNLTLGEDGCWDLAVAKIVPRPPFV